MNIGQNIYSSEYIRAVIKPYLIAKIYKHNIQHTIDRNFDRAFKVFTVTHVYGIHL